MGEDSFWTDQEMRSVLKREKQRQHDEIELIASENFVSEQVRAAVGSRLTNKYAEGYPAKRYYGGCQHVDEAEELARNRAKQLFGAEHANVQPHSGSQANMAAYLALLKPGQTILGMDLSHGGHLTHGSKVNFSGKLYTIAHYGITDEGFLDYESIAEQAAREKPDLVLAGASAYPRFIDFSRFKKIADEVDAKLLVDMAHIAGLVATGLHPNPVPCADVVTSTTHKTLRGPRGGLILCKQAFAKKIDAAIFPGTQGGPLMHVVAGKAVCFHEALQPSFSTYQQQVVKNAKTLAKTLLDEGFHLVSGGTDNHLLLVDLRNQGLTGNVAEDVLHRAGMTVNKNAIPNDHQPPKITSGIRIGTPAITTRGCREEEIEQIGTWIAEVLKAPEDLSLQKTIRKKAQQLCNAFPLH